MAIPTVQKLPGIVLGDSKLPFWIRLAVPRLGSNRNVKTIKIIRIGTILLLGKIPCIETDVRGIVKD